MSLAPGDVEPLLRGRFGRPYRFEPVCGSTQDLVRERELPEGAVVATDHQRVGRGRSGRSWTDTPGDSLLFSVLLRPPATPVIPQLSLVVAVSVAVGIEEVAAVNAGVKWPNDVEVDDRKVAGILLEASDGAVACGIGINVHQPTDRLPPDTRRPAASLLTVTGARHDRGRLLASILDALERRYSMWLEDGLAAVLPELEERSTLDGRRVAVGDVTGAVTGISADGRLVIRRADGFTTLADSGELEVLPG